MAVLIGLSCVSAVEAAPEVQKGELGYLLPRLQIEYDKDLDMPGEFRIYSVKEDGECGEPSKLCPKEELYIVLTNSEALPGQEITYHIPKAYSWTIKSVKTCGTDEDQVCVQLSLQETQLDTSGSKWKTIDHKYEVKIDSIKELN